MQAGQTLVIHPAAGAVGLACVEYWRMIEAGVIATAGSKEKRTFLREKSQLEDVFNIRDLSLASFRSAGTFHVLDLVTLKKHSPERIKSI